MGECSGGLGGDRRTAHRGMGGAGSNILKRLLLNHDGTMVRLLETVFDEPVDPVDVLQSTPLSPCADEVLGTTGGETILRRHVVLQGRHTGRRYVDGDSSIVLDRCPDAVRDGLLAGREPIGRLLTVHRVETYREPLETGTVRVGRLADQVGLAAHEELPFRSYRIWSGGCPLMAITELFPVLAYDRDAGPSVLCDDATGMAECCG